MSKHQLQRVRRAKSRRLARPHRPAPIVEVYDQPDLQPVRAVPSSDRDLSRYAGILRRRWRLALVLFAVVVTGVLAGMLLQPPRYRATGLLEIRRETTSAVPVDTLFTAERVGNDELETQFGILRSQTLADRVVAQLRGEHPPDIVPTSEAIRRRLVIDPQKGSRLVAIAFVAANPALAASVVNAVFDNYLQLRMEESGRSAELLAIELKRAKEKLQASEAQLQTYVRGHGLEILETGKGEMGDELNQRLRSLNESLESARAERFARQSAFELALSRASTNGLNSPVVEDLTVRIADLRREQAKLSATFHDSYPAVIAVKQQIAELQSALEAETHTIVNRLGREYKAAERREALLQGSLARQHSVARSIGQNNNGYEALKREVLTNRQMYAMLDQRLKDVSVSSTLKASNVGIIDRPAPPAEPIGSSPALAAGLATLVGLFIAVGGVFVREHMDTSVRSVDDVDSYLGVPTLAAIPAVSRDLRLISARRVGPRREWRRIDHTPGSSPLAEAFAALRTAVLFDDGDNAPRSVLITSAQSAEGKTTVSVNLALSLARLDHRVLLIDANMRFPCIHEALGIGPAAGLAEYLAGAGDWQSYVRPGPHDRLDVLVCGEPAANPADVLSLPRMRELVAAATASYDFVLIDSPALLANPADVRSLASLADSVLLTVRQGRTPREAVATALGQLGRVSGVVLNRSDFRDVPTYHRDVTVPGTT